MKTIRDVWFKNDRIYIRVSDDSVLSRPLKAFPRLYHASTKEREYLKIGPLGDDIRWQSLDEEIHITSFYDTLEPNENNEIAKITKMFSEDKIEEIAKMIAITPNLLWKYIYGIKTPSSQRKEEIKKAVKKVI